MAISAPAETTAAATVVQFWNVPVNVAVWITVFGLFITAVNFAAFVFMERSVAMFPDLSFADRHLDRSRICNS
jgi:Amino acid transporters